MNIESYKSYGPLLFGESSKEDCINFFGQPAVVRKNREGVEEFEYENFIARFDPLTSNVRQCTLLPYAKATMGDIEVTWDMDFLRKLCEQDGGPLDIFGFIVLRKIGVAVTGVHDGDDSQLAVTVFTMGAFDDLLGEALPFRMPA